MESMKTDRALQQCVRKMLVISRWMLKWEWVPSNKYVRCYESVTRTGWLREPFLSEFKKRQHEKGKQDASKPVTSNFETPTKESTMALLLFLECEEEMNRIHTTIVLFKQNLCVVHRVSARSSPPLDWNHVNDNLQGFLVPITKRRMRSLDKVIKKQRLFMCRIEMAGMGSGLSLPFMWWLHPIS